MKKWLKVIFLAIGVIVLLIIIDLICIFAINIPLLSIKDKEKNMYKGIFYDTYICAEFTVPQIVFKGKKFSCGSVIFNTDNNKQTYERIEVVKNEFVNDIRFNDYLKQDNRIVYLAGDIEEVFYYTDSNTKITLKEYITKSYKTMDDSLEQITNLLKYIDMIKDGGTTIYKSKEYDVTLVKCNTVAGNRDIFIGDYSMEFDNTMCK